MKRFMDKLVWIVSVCAMVALLTRCGGSVQEAAQEKAVEKAIEASAAANGEKVDVDMHGDGMTVATEEGKMQITPDGGGTVPKSFPGDVPLYDGAEVRSTMENTNDHTHMLQLFTKDPLAKVTEQIKAAAPPKGWTEDTTLSQNEGQPMSILTFKKGERDLSYVMTSEEGGTAIMMTVAGQ